MAPKVAALVFGQHIAFIVTEGVDFVGAGKARVPRSRMRVERRAALGGGIGRQVHDAPASRETVVMHDRFAVSRKELDPTIGTLFAASDPLLEVDVHAEKASEGTMELVNKGLERDTPEGLV